MPLLRLRTVNEMWASRLLPYNEIHFEICFLILYALILIYHHLRQKLWLVLTRVQGDYFGETLVKKKLFYWYTTVIRFSYMTVVESDVSLNDFIVGSLTFLYSDVFSINVLTVCVVRLFTLDIRHLLSFYSIDWYTYQSYFKYIKIGIGQRSRS